MNIERWKKGIETLERIRPLVAADPKIFDMRSWQCGTRACAYGWMAQEPWHQRQGLHVIQALPSISVSISVAEYFEIDRPTERDLVSMFFAGSAPYETGIAALDYVLDRMKAALVAKGVRGDPPPRP